MLCTVGIQYYWLNTELAQLLLLRIKMGTISLNQDHPAAAYKEGGPVGTMPQASGRGSSWCSLQWPSGNKGLLPSLMQTTWVGTSQGAAGTVCTDLTSLFWEFPSGYHNSRPVRKYLMDCHHCHMDTRVTSAWTSRTSSQPCVWRQDLLEPNVSSPLNACAKFWKHPQPLGTCKKHTQPVSLCCL